MKLYSFFLYSKFNHQMWCSEEELCVDLRNRSVRFRGPFRSSFLLSCKIRCNVSDIVLKNNPTLLKLWFLIPHKLSLTCEQVKQPVMCIVLATMMGFGLTMTGATAISEYRKWRRSHAPQSAEPARSQVDPPQAQTTD